MGIIVLACRNSHNSWKSITTGVMRFDFSNEKSLRAELSVRRPKAAITYSPAFAVPSA